MAKPPHVALLIETSLAYGRGLLRGVARYIHERGPWSIFFCPQGLDASPPSWLGKWRGQGILARIDNRRMARAVLRTGLPIVDVRNAIPGLELPGIGPDNLAVAQLVFQQLLDTGLRQFAFCAAPRGENRFLDARADAFVQLVEAAGYPCEVYESQTGRYGTWEQGQSRLARWLKRLPKPIGVMACDDDRGLYVLDACLRAKIQVPDQLAVIGVNNDEHLCGLANPALSSVDVGAERIGYEAAALLDRLMAGEHVPKTIIEMAPRGLVVRQSSDLVAISDPHVAAALRLIRLRAAENIAVSDLANSLDISRSTLERRFLKFLGRTPKQEIIRARLTLAKDLLLQTDLPLATIAERTGLRSLGYFCEVFHEKTGCTPGMFRRERSHTDVLAKR
jgi:LacI family transcriptional regulator